MKHLMITTVCLAFAAVPAMADTEAFRGLMGTAANLKQEASALRNSMKGKKASAAELKAEAEKLGTHINALRETASGIDGNLNGLNARQRQEWESVKTRIQLLDIVYNNKMNLLEGDVNKNRSLIRAKFGNIAERAEMLERAVSKLTTTN